MPYYMITEPRKRTDIERIEWIQFFLNNDIKEWIIAEEIGTFGYHHWQIRLKTRWNFEQMKKIFPQAHIEESTDLRTGYERKEGKFYAYDDTVEVLQERYAELTDLQQEIMKISQKQGQREVVVFKDNGNNGKSFLGGHLWETGKAFLAEAGLDSPKQIIQDICAGYNGQEYIILDIPYTLKWTPALYHMCERVKDGKVVNTRYTHMRRNIKGVKLIVFCNQSPDTRKLAKDRWSIYDLDQLKIKLAERKQWNHAIDCVYGREPLT